MSSFVANEEEIRNFLCRPNMKKQDGIMLLQMLALARQKELSHEDLMRFESLFGEVDDVLITLANELHVQQKKD